MRELLSFVLLACACGVSANAPPAGAGAETPATGAAPGASDAQGQSSAELDALAARGAEVAPGMREVARKENASEKTELARAEGRDACVRVAFSAQSPVAVKLVDERGGVLAAVDATTRGVLGEHGPVCVRAGDTVVAVVSPAGAPVAFVAWVAP